MHFAMHASCGTTRRGITSYHAPMTATHRPFRFGIQASTAPNRAEWVSLAQRAEAAGFDALTMPDHFGDQLAPVPAMMAAADATTDAARRRPGVRQRLQAPGRAGQGTGHDGRAQRRPGGDRPRRRLDDHRLRAVGHPLRHPRRAHRPLRGGPAHHHASAMAPGRSRSRASTTRSPTTTACPSRCSRAPPVLIGGGGKRVLAIAAREADIVGINPSMHTGVVGAETFGHMTRRGGRREGRHRARRRRRPLRRHRAEHPRVPGQRHRRRRRCPRASGRRAGRRRRRCWRRRRSRSSARPTELVERLLERRERWGFSYVIVGQEDVDKFAPVVARSWPASDHHGSRCRARA